MAISNGQLWHWYVCPLLVNKWNKIRHNVDLWKLIKAFIYFQQVTVHVHKRKAYVNININNPETFLFPMNFVYITKHIEYSIRFIYNIICYTDCKTFIYLLFIYDLYQIPKQLLYLAWFHILKVCFNQNLRICKTYKSGWRIFEEPFYWEYWFLSKTIVMGLDFWDFKILCLSKSKTLPYVWKKYHKNNSICVWPDIASSNFHKLCV